MFLRNFSIAFLLTTALNAFGAAIEKTSTINTQFAGTYNFHLFFGDSKPFLDELTLLVDDQGHITGTMHVPNDFDADVEDVILGGMLEKTLKFHISVPERYKKEFPTGLYYTLYFAPPKESYRSIDYSRFVGFATTHNSGSYRLLYVGSVVGFRKE